MTKISIGLAALAFTFLAPMAAQANTAVTDCALNVNTCMDGTNIVGKQAKVYSLTDGGGSITSDPTIARPGEKPIIEKFANSDSRSKLLSDDNNHATHLDW